VGCDVPSRPCLPSACLDLASLREPEPATLSPHFCTRAEGAPCRPACAAVGGGCCRILHWNVLQRNLLRHWHACGAGRGQVSGASER
jgi:hypothetical protein